MRIEVLTYARWWKLEGSLNQRLPGEDDIPELDTLQEMGEAAIRSILAKRGIEMEDWEVPFHYHRCPVLYAYVTNVSLVSLDLLEEINMAYPHDDFAWYAQLECGDLAGPASGMIIVRRGVAYFCAEDSLVSHLAPLIGLTPVKVLLLKLYSKIVSRPAHIRTAFRLWGWKGIFK